MLDLRATRPEIGDTQYVRRTVEWHDEVDEGIKRVEIRGDAQAVIDVRDVF